MKTVFVVRGSTGEYSGNRNWGVRAFETKAAAEAFEARCVDWLRKHRAHTSNDGRDDAEPLASCDEREALCNDPERLDQNLEISYTGTDYYLEEIPFEAEA